MKTQIIQLSQKEDSISVRDKISWSQTERILLVWPPAGKVLQHKLDLLLVNRFAASLGSQLALVTHDPEVRFVAREIGLPVFDSIRQAQEQAWPIHAPHPIIEEARSKHPDLGQMRSEIRTKRPAWIEHPAFRIGTLGLCILAILALALFFLPGARVVVNPKQVVQSLDVDVSAQPEVAAVNLSTGSVPAYFTEVTVEGTAVITSTGRLPLPTERATGSLEFRNRSKQSVTIPAGTLVSTMGYDPVEFITISAGDVVVKPNRSASVDAQAVKPGSAGNLSAGSLVVLDGQLGSRLTVTNPEATSGGTDVMIPSPSQQDVDRLRRQLTRQLEQNALDQLEAQLPAGDILLGPSVETLEILQESSHPAVGEPGDQLELSLRLRVQAQAISRTALLSLVNPIMDLSLSPGYTSLPSTLTITPAENPGLRPDGTIHLLVNARRLLQADVSPGQLAGMLKGLPVTEAKEQLSAQAQLADQASINLVPAWWPRLPYIPMRIEIVEAGTQ